MNSNIKLYNILDFAIIILLSGYLIKLTPHYFRINVEQRNVFLIFIDFANGTEKWGVISSQRRMVNGESHTKGQVASWVFSIPQNLLQGREGSEGNMTKSRDSHPKPKAIAHNLNRHT